MIVIGISRGSLTTTTASSQVHHPVQRTPVFSKSPLEHFCILSLSPLQSEPSIIQTVYEKPSLFSRYDSKPLHSIRVKFFCGGLTEYRASGSQINHNIQRILGIYWYFLKSSHLVHRRTCFMDSTEETREWVLEPETEYRFELDPGTTLAIKVSTFI